MPTSFARADFPGMAHGAVLASPLAAAGIHTLDTRRARQAPGVLFVLTGQDALDQGLGGIPTRADPTTRRLLANGSAACGADRVAFVVAETAAKAHAALELVTVTYRPGGAFAGRLPLPREVRAAIGLFDDALGCYTLYTSSRNPLGVRTLLCNHVFRMPEAQLRVIAPGAGQGASGLADASVEDALVLWAARHCGRPVKWVS